MMVRWNFGVVLITFVASFELLGSAHGRSNRVKNPLLDPSKANGFINSFLRYLIQSGAFAAKQEQDIADVIDTLQQAMSSTQSSKRGSAAKSQAMTLAFASVIADLVVIDDENAQGVSIEQKKSVIKQALEKAFMETQGSIDHSFIHEIDNLIKVFEEENTQSYDDNAEDSYQSYDDNSYGILQPVSDLGGPQIDAGVYGKFNLGAPNLFDSNLNLDVQPALFTSVSNQNQQGYGIDVSGNIAPDWNINLNQQAQQGISRNQNALNIYGIPSINTPQYFTDVLTRKLQVTRVFEGISKIQLSQKDWWFMSESICRILGNKFRIPINNSIINQLYQTLTKGAQSNELPSLFSAAISSTLGENILQTQGLLNKSLDSIITQTIEGILQGLGQALNINIDIKKALDLAAQVKVDAGVGLNANTGAAVGADIGAALGADVGVGLGSDVGLGLDANVGLDANANNEASANAGISTNLGLGFSPSADVGLGVGFNAPNTGLKLKNLLGLKLKATGVLDILASKKPSKSDIANISKLICRFLANKFQIQLNASMIKLLYGSLIKLNARARPEDFGNVLAAVIINILQSQGLLNVNLNTLLTQATECTLLGLSQALNINIDIKKALNLAGQVKVDIGIGANTDISGSLRADAEVGVGADVPVGLGTDVDTRFEADVGIGLDASLGTGANADLNANLGLGLLQSADKGLGVGLNIPNFGLKLTNLLALKLKATGVFNVLAKKTPSQSDFLNISKLISRLLANKFQIQLNASLVKLFYGSLIKLNGRAKPEDFANVLAASTMNILQSQGLLKINPDSLLTQATECILQGFAKALDINIDIKNALDLATQVQVDIGVGVDADTGAGLNTDIGIGLGADVGIGLGGDVSFGIGAGIGAGLGASVGVDTNLGLDLSPSTGIGQQTGLNVPNLGLKLTNLLGLKLKATGMLNILATKTPSRSHIVNISKSVSKLLATKFQIQFNGSMIKLFYNSLAKLDATRKPDDFANVLAAVTINILQSQGLLNINLDSLLSQATECILLGLREALNINVDIKKALDLAAQVKVDVGADVGLAGNVAIGVGADAGVDANTNLGIQEGPNIDASANADVNTNLGLGLSPSTGMRLGVGLNVPDLGLKLKNLLVLKLKAAGVLNILATKAPSRSDIVNISKSICRLLANKFQIKLDVSMIKLLYGSLAKFDATAKPDDFANVLAAVTMNILQSQGLLNINLDTLLTQATECILLGLGQALNIDIDIKSALDLAAKMKVDAGAGVDVDVGVGLGADIEAGVGLGAKAGIGLDAGVGIDADANLGIQVGADVDTSADVNANLGVGLKPSPDVRLGVGINVPDISLKLKNLLSLKLKATGALNVLETKRLSRSDIMNISKLICRLLANKFQVQFNVSTIKVLYGSLIKLNARATPEDFANVLATVTINILQSQGLLDINLDTLLTQAIECILLGLGQALNVNLDIKKALDLAAQVKVDISADVNADAEVSANVGLGLGTNIGLGVGADTGTDLDASGGVDANANLDVQAGAKVDADVNAYLNSDLGLGLSPSTGVGLGVGANAPALGVKLGNLLALKLKATGALNILATKRPSRSDIVNISKSICRLLVNKFQIKLNVSMIKLLYGSLAKLGATAKADDFADVLAAVTMNILQSQGLLNINLDSLLTQATECILLGLGQALNINIDIQNALGLAAKIKVDAAIGVDADVGVGLGADVGVDLSADVGVGADAGIGIDANVGVDANTNLGILAGADIDTSTNADINANLGVGLSSSADVGLGVGMKVPNLGLKLKNLLALKLKATGVLNILGTRKPSKSDIVNISKLLCRLLANKFQIQLNVSTIKVLYGSLIKLNARATPEDFANVLATVTINILQSQGLLDINLDTLLTQAIECILLGLGQALNVNLDIKKALDLAAQVKVDISADVNADAGVSADVGFGLGADIGLGLGADTVVSLDANAGADTNANLGAQVGAKVDADVNTDIKADLGSGLKNLLALKLKATGVLNILATKTPSRSDIVNISKSICRLLANKFQIKLNVSMIKLMYGSLAKLGATAKADDFADVLAAVTMNILQSQGLLNINLDSLLTQATECILLGLGQALNINIDIQNALGLAAKIKVDAAIGVDADVGVGLGADVGVDLSADVGVGADAGIGIDANVGVDANTNLGILAGADIDTSTNADINANLGVGLSSSADVGLGVGMKVPDLGLKLKNLLALKLKATGVLNILGTRKPSKSDIVNISKLLCRLLANKFQIQLNVSTIKVLYGSLIKLNARATPEDFANALATVTINILQSQGLLDINLDTLLTQATECILLGLGQALNINLDIKKALDLAAQVKVDISADVNADAGVSADVGFGLGADIGLGLGADTVVSLDANAGADTNANLDAQVGAKVDADVNTDIKADLGSGLKNLLALKLKATGVLNILATKTPSRSDIVNISKSICRLLANKFQIKLNVSMIKLLYGSLAKLGATAKADDFADVLAAVTMNILQSQGLLNINLDSLLTQATEGILLGLGQALNINIDIQNALGLAAKIKVDAAIGVDADVGVGLGADVGVDLSADAGIGIDANVGVDANTNLGILAGADIDTSTNADINANLGVGLSSSADVGLGVGMKVPDLGLKLKNLLALKLKATGVLNILGTRKPSKSDIVNISKLICRLLANKFQIQLNVPTIKLLYGSLIKVNARATPEDFANVLATVTINILQSQGLLDINLNTLLTQATECILLGLGQALNINLDIKKALDLAAKVDIGVDLNADAGVSADVGLGLGADIGLGIGADTGVSLDANLGAQAGAKVDVDINTDINADLGSGLSSSTEQGLGVGVNVPDISLKLKNLLALKLKATGVLNILATKTPSRSDIVNISKSICRLLANKFQIKLNVSMIKLLYSSLAKLDATAKPDDFANVLATVTSNILQSQGLLNISLDSLLTQATECILLGLGQTLNINVDIKNALDLAAKVDAGVAVDASVGVGLDADVEAGLGLGTDIGIGLGVGAEAGIGANAGLGIGTEIDANANLGVQAGANLGLGLSPSADIGLGIGLDIPNLILKLRNTLSLKLKATGVLNILATKTLSKTDFVNISKSICRLLANKFQIQLNASMIKLFYGSLIKLNGRAKPDDFANVLAAVTMNILQSQGLLNINIDPLLTQATECILLGFGQALNISVDIKNALDLAAQVKVDVGVGVEANTGASIEANVGAAADLGTGLDVGLDANTNLDVQAGAKVDADVNANLGLGISPSVDVLGAGLKVPGLSLKLKNLLALKLKATGVLNILVQNQPSKSDIVNISKSISRLLANRFQIQLTTSMIKQLYGSFIKLNSRGKADDFANVLSTVTMNILQSQGLLNISLDTLLNQATECIILGLKQALNINVDVKKALDLAVQVKADIDVGVDADVGVGADVGVDLDSGTGVDISAGIDVNAGANVDVGVNADVSTNLGLDVSPSVDVEVEAGLNIPNLGLKLRNILTQKLKATGVLNVLTTKTSSKSDIVNISKLICRLLANKFQIQLNASMIKLFYGSLIKLNGRAKPDDFAAVLATVTMNILQSQGLLNKNLDLLLTQATECILLGLKQALNINVDIKTAADLAAQVKLDVGADIDADLGVGFTTDAGVGIGADLGIGLDAGVGVNASANLGVQAGADVSADANADVNANIGLSLSSSTNEGLGVGLNVPKLGLKLRNLLALKLKATGVLNILATNRPSKTDIINISKQISRLLANKFQIQLNASMIKLLYNSLIKLNDRGKPDDFGNILAAGTVSILESQGLLNINLDSLLTPILECILRGLGQALRINIDIKKALDLAAQLKTDVGVDLDADPGIGLGTDLGITTDTGLGLDADVNANVGAQAGVNVDAGIDINANQDLGLSPSANVGLGAGLNSPNLSLKLRNLLALKLKATGVLNVLATRRLSKSDTVNISKLICRLLAKKFQIQLNASRVKLLYGSLIKLNARAKPDDFANVLSAVIMNILQSQGLLRNNLNSLLTQATECILLGLGRALNINIDIKKALDLSAQVKVDVEVGVDTDVGIGADTKVGVDVDTNVGLDLDANVGVGLDTDVGLGTDIGLGLDAGVGIDATANLGVQAAADISADTGVGVNVDSKLLNVDAKVKADVKAEAAEQLADALKSSEEFKLAILMGQEETVLSAIGNVINDIFGRKAGISFLSKFNMSFD